MIPTTVSPKWAPFGVPVAFWPLRNAVKGTWSPTEMPYSSATTSSTRSSPGAFTSHMRPSRTSGRSADCSQPPLSGMKISDVPGGSSPSVPNTRFHEAIAVT